MVLETTGARRSILFQFKQDLKSHDSVNNNSIATFFSHCEKLCENYEIRQEPCL